MKTLKECLQENCTIWWWNMGKKKQDFKGSYFDFFKSRGIRCSLKVGTRLSSGNDTITITFSVSNSTTRIQSFHLTNNSSDYLAAFDEAIKAFLGALGDKSILRGQYGREYKINWR